MPIIEWNSGFLLGIQEIDKRHKNLVQLLNKTYDEFRGGKNIELSVLDELIDYSDYIFNFEESMMLDVSYPDRTGHQKEHESFTDRILEFKKTFKQNKNTQIELLWFLCNWVTHHMRETDAELGRFIDIQNINKRMNR